ncbi:MAG TPA: alpha-glucosidase [Rectinemataceae bacterium]|nr:alpha-glucosidase [Rectinemataceae bacterium]
MKRTWWKEGVVYQIYPRSFKDSNGDGIGDLRGIVEKADYIASLGVDIVWLNPIYSSPNKDNGYDISDYENIMEEFGSLADFDELVTAFHARGIRLVMDLVVNHSSNEHPWFLESRSSRESPKRDYYIWKPGKNGGPPNGWEACFGGSAWEYDERSGEYYLHLFTPEQPDLNWENPGMRRAVYAMMRRWFERGVDGFRMDVITMLSKEPSYRDLLPGEGMFSSTAPYIYGPRLHEFIREMRREAIDGFDAMTVGEAPGTTIENAVDLVGEDRGELDMAFQFELMGVDYLDGDKWKQRPIDLVEFKEIIERWQVGMFGKAWNSNFLMNHDQPRSVSRFGDDGRYRVRSAKALLALDLSLCGTPYVYQGEEIGMTNVAFPSIEDYRDIETLNYYRRAVEGGAAPERALASIHYMSRDNSRTPMQWDSSPGAGFSGGRPWIGLNPKYPELNVERAEADENSVLHFLRRMIRFRKDHLCLVYGSFELIARDDPALFAYFRDDGSERLLVAINMSGGEARLPSDIAVGPSAARLALLLSSAPHGDDEPSGGLEPWEARVYRVG